MSIEDRDLGGDPACWAHLFDDLYEPRPCSRSAADAANGDAPVGAPLPSPPGAAMSLSLDTETLARLVHELADAVIVADATGTIVLWNAAAERLFGWSSDHAVGQSLDLIIPERQRARHWEGYRQVMGTGETRYGTELLQVPSLHADGQRHSIAFTVTLLHDPSGAVSGIAAVVRDETDRRAAETELRRKLHELEQATP